MVCSNSVNFGAGTEVKISGNGSCQIELAITESVGSCYSPVRNSSTELCREIGEETSDSVPIRAMKLSILTMHYSTWLGFRVDVRR